jgi:Arc/MetJ-type ribon-helix-helix transcriptional regulator
LPHRGICTRDHHENITDDRELGGIAVSKISVEIPDELLADLDEHVGEDGKFVNRSDAIRASIRKTLDLLDEIDARHGRLEDDE